MTMYLGIESYAGANCYLKLEETSEPNKYKLLGIQVEDGTGSLKGFSGTATIEEDTWFIEHDLQEGLSTPQAEHVQMSRFFPITEAQFLAAYEVVI